MDLRLVVRLAGGPDRDLQVTAGEHIAVGVLCDHLAAELGGASGGMLEAYSPRQKRRLPAKEPLSTAGLRQGDRIEIRPPSGPDSRPEPDNTEPPIQVLEFLSGPGAGRSYELEQGDYALGRDRHRANIVIDDASVSARHLAIRVTPAELLIRDARSSNGTLLEGNPVSSDVPSTVSAGDIIQVGRSLIRFRPWLASVDGLEAGSDGTIAFNRPPRVAAVPPPLPLPIDVPGGPTITHRIPIATSLLPLAAGIVLAVVVSPAMLVFAALSPIIAVLSVWIDRRSSRREFQRRAIAFRAQLVEVGRVTRLARDAERIDRRRENPDAPTLIRRATDHEPDLWDRRPDDPDFMCLRVGSGRQPTRAPLEVSEGGDAGLTEEARALAAELGDVPAVPVVIDLRTAGGIGAIGPSEPIARIARWLVLQAAILHSPRDVVVTGAIERGHLDEWEFLKWLPHTRSETSPLRTHLADDRQSADALVGAIAEIATRRIAAMERLSGGAPAIGPLILAVIDEAIGVEPALVAGLLANAPRSNIVVLWLGSERTRLPGDCTQIVDLDAAIWRLALTETRTGRVANDVIAEGVSRDVALDAALGLAPLRDIGAQGAGAALPSRVSLTSILGPTIGTAQQISGRWQAKGDDLSAVIGTSRRGPTTIDIRRDGPHGLVAGTTGAGKSELLQTIVISMAAGHSPRELTFLLVDYKGGAAFRECALLPHTVGLVTDLDPHLARRVLDSLNAELKRRERIVRDGGAKDLVTLAAMDPAAAPPSLLLVIDEFATLVTEIPDFVDGVVNVAQRGRSLGLHLLLATQRPAGVVTANIRANTNLRIALRVNDPRESEDVIESPDAARIPRSIPGRAYIRTGHSELVEFQTGYVGGRSATAQEQDLVSVEPFRFVGARRAAPASEVDPGSGATDLSQLVERIGAAASAAGIERPRSPWLPPLPKLLPLPSPGVPPADQARGVAEIGLIDEPARQEQRPFVVDLANDGSVLVYGTSGSGKTTLLRTIAVDLASRASPRDLNLYALDFASRGLAPLAALPHCGAVISGDDDERTQRLFARLEGELLRRKELFARAGAFSLDEFAASAGGEAPPRLVVLLDGYAAFAAAYERVNYGAVVEGLPRLVSEGRQLGVHFVITVERRGAIPSALAAVISNRIVLRQAEPDDYPALGVNGRHGRTTDVPPGRAFVTGDLEAQVAVLGADPSGSGQAAAIDRLAEELRARHGPTVTAPAIDVLPAQIDLATLPRPDRRLVATLGLGHRTLEPAGIDLEIGHLLVLGPHRSGRSTALGTVVASLLSGPVPPRLELLAPRRSPLTDVAGWEHAARTPDECQAAAARLVALLNAGDDPGPGGLVVVIDDGEELEDTAAANDLAVVARRGRDLGVRIVGAAEIRSAHRAFSGWMTEVRKEQQGLLLDPDSDIDGDLFGARLPRRTQRAYPPGRGFLVRRGEPELIQVARSENRERSSDGPPG